MTKFSGATAYPLTWPEGMPRNTMPLKSAFKQTVAAALNNVTSELARFAKDSGRKVENLLISSNYSLSDQRPKDCGVAVYFSWDGIHTCIAVDRYNKLEDNLQAIYHCIGAERVKLRHGGLNIVKAAFRGYAALPPPRSGKQTWWEVLGVNAHTPTAEVDAAYKKARFKAHPDQGGSAEKFNAVQEAFDQFKKARGLP